MKLSPIEETRQGLALEAARELIDRELAAFEATAFERWLNGRESERERDTINGARQFRDILAGCAARAKEAAKRE